MRDIRKSGGATLEKTGGVIKKTSGRVNIEKTAAHFQNFWRTSRKHLAFDCVAPFAIVLFWNPAGRRDGFSLTGIENSPRIAVFGLAGKKLLALSRAGLFSNHGV